MNKTTTNSPLGMIIPINPATGLIMISYTDGERAKDLKKSADTTGLETIVARHLNSLFPGAKIPEPLWMRDY